MIVRLPGQAVTRTYPDPSGGPEPVVVRLRAPTMVQAMALRAVSGAAPGSDEETAAKTALGELVEVVSGVSFEGDLDGIPPGVALVTWGGPIRASILADLARVTYLSADESKPSGGASTGS